jgi:hypothetical protein
VPEGHHDLRTARARAQVLNDLRAQQSPWISGENRDSLGIEQHHSGPADPFPATVASGEIHDEEIAFVIEEVSDVLEFRHCLVAQRLQKLEMPLAPFERLFHRDHSVSEHAGLWHMYSQPSAVISQPADQMFTPASLKISLAMMSRWISLVPS